LNPGEFVPGRTLKTRYRLSLFVETREVPEGEEKMGRIRIRAGTKKFREERNFAFIWMRLALALKDLERLCGDQFFHVFRTAVC
jgi:hypothetical protein